MLECEHVGGVGGRLHLASTLEDCPQMQRLSLNLRLIVTTLLELGNQPRAITVRWWQRPVIHRHSIGLSRRPSTVGIVAEEKDVPRAGRVCTVTGADPVRVAVKMAQPFIKERVLGWEVSPWSGSVGGECSDAAMGEVKRKLVT